MLQNTVNVNFLLPLIICGLNFVHRLSKIIKARVLCRLHYSHMQEQLIHAYKKLRGRFRSYLQVDTFK